MAGNPETNAMVRTTAAITQLSGSDTINTLPKIATAGLSVRIASQDSVEKAVAHIKTVAKIKLDLKITYQIEPSPISNFKSPAFQLITNTVKKVYPFADTAPYVMNGGTDSKHFTGICDNVYRFGGFFLTGEERKSIHAANERLPIDTFYKGIEFYIELFQALND